MLVGQTVATRVSGDSVSGNNGISYFYNDHLGSNTALRRPNGSRVSTYYHPFGNYRGTALNQTITDRDFTGQPQNRAVGLLYYQARFYVPGIGRFASADTLVPDPMNPQQFNRYSYVLNNALRYTDPGGRYCYDPTYGGAAGQCYSDDGQLLTRPRPPKPSVPRSHRGNEQGIVPGFTLSEDDLLLLTLGVFAENQNASHPAYAMEMWAWVFLNKQARSPGKSIYSIIESSSGAWNDPPFVAAHRPFRGDPPIDPSGHREWLLSASRAYMSGSSRNSENFQVLHKQITGDGGIYDNWRLHGTNSAADPTYGAEIAVHRASHRFERELGPLFTDYAQINPAFSYLFSDPYLGMMTVVGNHGCIYDHSLCR
jgi:RHS repeat-associated protein